MTQPLNVYPVPYEVLHSTVFDGFCAMVTQSNHAGEVSYEQCCDAHRIFITLAGQTGSTIGEIDDHPVVRRPDQPGVVTIVPAGTRRRVSLRDINFRVLDMTVSDSFLRLCAGEETDQIKTLPIVQNMRSLWLMHAAQAFYEEGVAGASAMQMQTLAFALVKHLARSPDRISDSGGLNSLALARVLQLMHDRLADDLTLTDLAFEAGLGVSAFSRAFAKSLGQTPYRFLIAIRMQRAMEQLAYTSRPLTDIAAETGYADQAHFTAAFKRHTGVSPGKWRAEFGTVHTFTPISRKTTAPVIA